MRKKPHELSVDEIAQEIEMLILEQYKISIQQKIELGKLHLEYPIDFPIEWFELNTRISQLEREWAWRLDPEAQAKLNETLKSFRQQISNAGKYHEMKLRYVTPEVTVLGEAVSVDEEVKGEYHKFRRATKTNIETDYNKVLRKD